jgi:hypothetical protein
MKNLLSILSCAWMATASAANVFAQSVPPEYDGMYVPGQAIPKQFFGMISTHTYPIQLTYGQWRVWDSGAAWPYTETCKAQSGSPTDQCFDWTALDSELASVSGQGIQHVLFTLSRSPRWAVNLNSDPTGQKGQDCGYYKAGSQQLADAAGQCLIPVDLNPDGTGTNKMWKDWVTALATHVKNTHPQIKWWWEPWNESFRSTTITSPPYTGPGPLSYEGTFAQMVRLTEDARCIITGKGVIHNFPTVGTTTPCTLTAIDPTAMISSPSGGFEKYAEHAVQNFLYCDASPPAGSQCTTGSAGSNAVDGINYHMYAGTVTPEENINVYLPAALATLQTQDLNKPLINGEGSWGDVSNAPNIWKDPYAQAGFLPRYFALYLTAGVNLNDWYAYDGGATGWGGMSDGVNLLHPQSDSWQQTTSWLIGSTPVNEDDFCDNKGTIYTCDMTRSNGKAAELVWDSAYGQNCSQMAVPIICGSTSYPVPTKYNGSWIDLKGTVHSHQSTVKIGANPILLEAQ